MNPPPEYHNGQLAPTNTPKAVEEWEDDDVITPIDATEQVHICPPTSAPAPLPSRNTKSVNLRASRLSTPKVRRIRSRQRQKAQNAKAGIRAVPLQGLCGFLSQDGDALHPRYGGGEAQSRGSHRHPFIMKLQFASTKPCLMLWS